MFIAGWRTAGLKGRRRLDPSKSI